MTKTLTIRVTAEMLKALDDLAKAVKDMPAGAAKTSARAALLKLKKSVGAFPAPAAKVRSCPRDLPNW
jgi:hypothetical protein